VGPRASLEGAEYLAPTGLKSPDRPARSKSLYRLTYPGTHYIYIYIIRRANRTFYHFTRRVASRIKTDTHLCDFRLPPRCKYDLHSSEMLCSLDWSLRTDVLGNIFLPNSKVKYSTSN